MLPFILENFWKLVGVEKKCVKSCSFVYCYIWKHGELLLKKSSRDNKLERFWHSAIFGVRKVLVFWYFYKNTLKGKKKKRNLISKSFVSRRKKQFIKFFCLNFKNKIVLNSPKQTKDIHHGSWWNSFEGICASLLLSLIDFLFFFHPSLISLPFYFHHRATN